MAEQSDQGTMMTTIKFVRTDGDDNRSIELMMNGDDIENENSYWRFAITELDESGDLNRYAEIDMTQRQLREFCKRTLQVMGD